MKKRLNPETLRNSSTTSTTKSVHTTLFESLCQRSEFAHALLTCPQGNPFTPRIYQRPSLESWAPRKVHCDGRDVGKTTEIEVIALWAALCRPNTQMLIATQCENHLEPLMNRIATTCETNPLLRQSLVRVNRTPAWRLCFANGFILWGRIAGPRGVNFQGIHVDWQLIDEAQELTTNAWNQLYQSLNTGGYRWVYGVPNGLRNTFYTLTHDNTALQFHWPSTLNPDYTPEKDAELARLYGGRLAPAYLHQVLGQHGEPEHAVFDLDNYLACVDESIPFQNITLTEDDPFEAPANVPNAQYYLGCDLGYARDPSEFVVYQAAEPDLVNVLRVHLHGVNYARQENLIAQLERAYNFQAIAIDCGNNGRAVAHALIAREPQWAHKIHPIDFGAVLPLHLEPDFPAHASLRRPAKEFMTELLQRRLHERTIRFPRLPERETQYANHTYQLAQNARIIYNKGNDHIIDADRCALVAHYIHTNTPQPVSLGVRIHFF